MAAYLGLFRKMSFWHEVLDPILDAFPLKDTNIVDYHSAITSIFKKRFTTQDMKNSFSALPAWQQHDELWAPDGDFENLLVNYLPTCPG